MKQWIIDFHTHPFRDEKYNICAHKSCMEMNADTTLKLMDELDVEVICGSVIRRIKEEDHPWELMRELNDEALALRDYYGDRYVPGFHVHPDFVRESCEEIERMHRLGVNLVGELVPYCHGWRDYSCKGFSEILDLCDQYGMFQISGEDINTPRQSFIIRAMENPMFKNLIDATWKLIEHEKQ